MGAQRPFKAKIQLNFQTNFLLTKEFPMKKYDFNCLHACKYNKTKNLINYYMGAPKLDCPKFSLEMK